MNGSIDKASLIRDFTLSNKRVSDFDINKIQFKLKPSAVLVPITELDGELHLILTKRALHLKHHPGQISFPGGKVEPNDRNEIETALRETEEEIGIAPSSIDVLGTLPYYQTLTGFQITPVLAFVNQPIDFITDHNEVAEVFQVPLNHFLEQKNHYSFEVLHRNRQQLVHYLPYKHYNIWGATAAIIKGLIYQLDHQPLSPSNKRL